MALLKYLKASKDGLPDPKGSLLSAIPSQVIAEAKQEVKQLLSHANEGKRGPYKRYIYPCKSLLNMCINFNLYHVDIVQKRGLQLFITLVIMGSQQLQYISQENLAIVCERALYTVLNIPK